MKNKPKTMAEQMSSAGDSSMLTMNRFIKGNILSPTEKEKDELAEERDDFCAEIVIELLFFPLKFTPELFWFLFRLEESETSKEEEENHGNVV